MVPADDDIEIILPSGRQMPIHIEDGSNFAARRAMSSLRYGIYISSRNLSPPPTGRSTIYFVGRVIGTIPAVKATKTTEGIEERLRFELLGWYLKDPYIEYPQLPPDQDKNWKPILRHTLEGRDFKDPDVMNDFHFDRKRHLYWVGLNPNGEK